MLQRYIVSLLKKIYKRDAPFRAVSKVKTLAVLFSPYPGEMKHIPRNLNLPPFWRLLVSIEMVQSIPTRALTRARGLSMRTHLTAVEPKASNFTYGGVQNRETKNRGLRTIVTSIQDSSLAKNRFRRRFLIFS